MRDHTKLAAFRLADQLALMVYEVTRYFPTCERFGLTSQMRRAAVSTAANIVEASARLTEADYLRMLSIAYGSAKELQYEISLAIRLNYIDNQQSDRLRTTSTDTCRALAGLIAAIRNRTDR